MPGTVPSGPLCPVPEPGMNLGGGRPTGIRVPEGKIREWVTRQGTTPLVPMRDAGRRKLR